MRLESTIAHGVSTISTIHGDELTGRFSVKPSGKSTESCKVTADLDKDDESVYLFCELDDCPEAAFFNVGTLSDVYAKAEALSKEGT